LSAVELYRFDKVIRRLWRVLYSRYSKAKKHDRTDEACCCISERDWKNDT